MAQRLALFVLLLLGMLTGFTVIDWHVQGERVRRTLDAIRADFPGRMALADAHAVVAARYPIYTQYSTQECERGSGHGVPAYTARGGPCIFDFVKVGETWWGFQSGVEFRLIFGPDDRLLTPDAWPVYTFL